MQSGGTLCTLVAIPASVFLMSALERLHAHSDEGIVVSFTPLVDKCKHFTSVGSLLRGNYLTMMRDHCLGPSICMRPKEKYN
jgi:hypothetical protein